MSADLHSEQTRIDVAYECLAAMRERARRVLSQASRDADSSAAPDHVAIERSLVDRLAAMAESSAPLAFGRIDENGERHYVGRRHVEDQGGNPVVIDWRAPAAAPFYRATWADPLGLDLRRRFALEGRTLVGVFDEDFNSPDGDTGTGGGVPDPLLIELERARTGEMRDIVATIQAEQDVVIRADLDELLVVQGGPGTGKTAVGLHRAAFLLYAHRAELERKKVLVIGPNPVFLDYIGHVLPSLGETSVVQATIERLLARQFPVRATDAHAVARLKGDARMADLIARHLVARRVAPTEDGSVMTAFGTARFPASDVAALIAELSTRRLASNDARNVLRDQLVSMAWSIRAELPGVSPEQRFTFSDSLRGDSGFKKLLDVWWPTLSAASVVRTLLGNGRALAEAADGLLSVEEQKALRRRASAKVSDERWTRGDLALLDEANALTAGDHPVFGHVVVDEAQDLSAMELRMAARRASGGSMTVLGDLAQATGPGSLLNWGDSLSHLGHLRPRPGRVAELGLGYRVPAPVLDFANRLLPLAAPGVRPARSVRTAGADPLIVSVEPARLCAAVAREAVALASVWATVGVLVPDALVGEVATALDAAGQRWHERLADGVTLLPAVLSKGLEFDAVVVAEPAAIVSAGSPASRPASDGIDAAADATGHRVLYVALTRAVQRLTLVHSQPLPDLLR